MDSAESRDSLSSKNPNVCASLITKKGSGWGKGAGNTGSILKKHIESSSLHLQLAGWCCGAGAHCQAVQEQVEEKSI